MGTEIKRREFLELTLLGTAFGLAGPRLAAAVDAPSDMPPSKLISPGCRRSKVKVARIFMGNPAGLWPKPQLDLQAEMASYNATFESLKPELCDVEFIDQLATTPEHVQAIAPRIKEVDGILAIHLSIGIGAVLQAILKLGKPTVVFAIPYSGHEWASFGALVKQPEGARLDCVLSADRRQLAAAIRPFRAIHHLREARVLNVTLRKPGQYEAQVKEKFGTEIRQIGLAEVEKAYQAVSDREAQAEADRWIRQAQAVVEPTPQDIFKACKLALAFERMLDEAEATVLTVDCYGTMWDKTIKLPAYPCLGFSRLNSMGLGGICESDLRSALTHIVFQGLAGRPGFISDPTMDESTNTIILAHCMGTRKMLGPEGPDSPYKIRTVMERQEGVVPQVFMPVGQKVTQALVVGTDLLVYFTGEVVDAPDVDRGCRTKITVRIDGNAETLWRNWSHGLHRVTCYGDLTKDLQRFCRFMGIRLVNEAV